MPCRASGQLAAPRDVAAGAHVGQLAAPGEVAAGARVRARLSSSRAVHAVPLGSRWQPDICVELGGGGGPADRALPRCTVRGRATSAGPVSEVLQCVSLVGKAKPKPIFDTEVTAVFVEPPTLFE